MPTFFCPLCKNNFAKAHFQRHYKTIHKYEKAVPCKKCGEVFSSEKDLCNHYKNVENLIIFQCEVCDRPCFTAANLTVHKINTHGISSKKIQVSASNSKVISSFSYSKMSTFFCPLCNDSFGKANFQRHYKRIHKYEKAVPCKKCGEVFSSLKALCNHYRNVENETIFQCELCNKPFLKADDLGTHKNHTHGISSQKTQVSASDSKGKSSKVKVISSNHSNKRRRVLSEQQINCLNQDEDISSLDDFNSAENLNSEIEDLK